MYYISTRNKNCKISGAEAIVKGISDDGGLFVPEEIPSLSFDEIEKLLPLSYEERAAFVMQKFLPEFSHSELLDICEKAYSKFESDESAERDPIPLVKTTDLEFILELWHGPTLAFKDVALTILPHLLVLAKKKLNNNSQTKILVATSGDTGKAALEGFRDVPGTSITVFYPSDGVSTMQKLQMSTQEGNNVKVYAVKGNFDDCQRAVKTIFADEELISKLKSENIELSSANSINFGRLLPQIVYYISAYCDMVSSEEIKQGDKINFCVPTGNFGNILAGWYAYKMGLPVGKFICASNSNNVLTDFFRDGIYDCNREFYKTFSPSMDILISSNLERLIFESCNRNDEMMNTRMTSLKQNGKFAVTKEEVKHLSQMFFAEYASEDDTLNTISEYFEEYGYVLDTHTAVAISVNAKYIKKKFDKTKCVILSTANPYKFAQDVLFAISAEDVRDGFRAIKKLHAETGMAIPNDLATLKDKPKRFVEILSKTNLKEFI